MDSISMKSRTIPRYKLGRLWRSVAVLCLGLLMVVGLQVYLDDYLERVSQASGEE
jgi:hypothetical protein